MELNEQMHYSILYVSWVLNESFRKTVLRHKSNRLRMSRNNLVVISSFVSLDLCILQKPERGHSSQFCDLFSNGTTQF